MSVDQLELLPEDESLKPINEDDVFTHDPLEPPLVKVRFSNGTVYGHGLDGLARWLVIKRNDPLMRTAFYTDDQVMEIRRRFGYFSFLEHATKVLSPDLIEQLKNTHNDIEKLKLVFASFTNTDLSICLFAAHRLSFRIFREIYLVGKQRKLFDITTLELVLSESVTDDADAYNRFEFAFFTLRLFRLFSAEINELPARVRVSHKIRQAVGHFVFSAQAPCLRSYLLPTLVYHHHVIPKQSIRKLWKVAKTQHDAQLSNLLIKYRLISEGLVPLNHPYIKTLLDVGNF